MTITCLQSPPKQKEQLVERRLVKWHSATIKTTRTDFNDIKRFVDKSLVDIPRFIQRRLIEIYIKQFHSETAKDAKKAASIGLRKATKPIQKILEESPFQNRKALRRIHVLKKEAEKCAEHCLLTCELNSDADISYEDKIKATALQLAKYTESKGISSPFNVGQANDPDKPCNIEVLESAVLRMVCDEWWERKFKRIRDQINEFIAIASGIIKKKHQEYCSNVCVSNWRQQRRANADYLQSMNLVNEETDERFNLAEIAAATTANPDLRRVELFVRVRGLEEIAIDLGYESFFITWTAPSKWHRGSHKWNGARPDETQKYLCGQWAKCRASIARHNVHWFGVRVAEPHASATPHWHMLVWCKKEDSKKVKGAFREYALEHDADEKGAQKNRIQFENIDPAKGSATGYIAKYIAKNINAKNVEHEPDFDGSGSLRDAADRVVAWASLWRIRQFQFFGAAKVSIWRECRRMREPLENEAMEAVRSAADAGKWQAFTEMLAKNPVSIMYQSEERNRYNESVSKIVGLVCDGFEKLTRSVKYRLEKAGAARKGSASPATWSTVNNCTKLYDNAVSACKVLGFSLELARPLAAGSGVVEGGRGFRIINGELREFAP